VHYCADHAGINGLCAQCGQSSNLGIWVLAAVGLILGVLLLFGLFQRG
jgi:hypothetical protein